MPPVLDVIDGGGSDAGSDTGGDDDRGRRRQPPPRDRFLESMRRRAARRLGDAAALERARHSAEQRARRASVESTSFLLQQRRAAAAAGAPAFLDPGVDDDDSVSVASGRTAGSREWAAARGARRAAAEPRDGRGAAGRSFASEDLASLEDGGDFDSEYGASTTVTDAITDFSPSRVAGAQRQESKAGPAKGKKSFKNKKKRGKALDNESIAASCLGGLPSVWMCGVCGKAFGTFEGCDRHEDWHIQTVCAEFIGKEGFSQRLEERKDALGDEAASNSLTDRLGSTRQRLFTEDEAFPSPTAGGERRLPSPLNMLQMAWGDVKASEEKTQESKALEFWANNSEHPFLAAGSKPRLQHEVRFNEFTTNEAGDFSALIGAFEMRDYLTLADEALVSVCERAKPLLLTAAELKAERNLALLSRDKAYYDELAERAIVRRKNPYTRFRSEGDTLRDRVHNKLLDAYQIMKQGDNTRGMTDQYTKAHAGDDKNVHAMAHSDKTLFVNVMVKNSIQVVKRELERLAQERWERPDIEMDEKMSKFQRFRVYAHANMIKLAGLALASDFTPRRIAIQLSNDLYRLMTPRLKRRGVVIETEIEYRVGGYFVLAVNITSIDWLPLMKANVIDVSNRLKRWKKDNMHRNDEVKTKEWFWNAWLRYFRRLLNVTWFDILSHTFTLLYQVHWTISIPICWLLYHSPLGVPIRMFILSSVTDEIFYYIERKGMEMVIRVLQADRQAAFMLQALREIRADGRELRKKRQETEALEVGIILGNLLGPSIKADKEPAPPPPESFVMPVDLEFVGFEVELPVGFRRLRWALLSDESKFLPDAMMKTEGKYERISIQPWERHSEHIGKAVLPDNVNSEEFIGVSKEQEYLMPKSAFVAANMAYETLTIIAYNESCFAVKKKTRTPDVPFGGTFFSWTMIRFENLGKNTVRMTCSVEAEFPSGPPMIARQIQSGMRAGTAENFISLGETITKYAEAFP